MDIQEIQRIIQYVTARTNFSRSDIESIIQTGFQELSALAQHSSRHFNRDDLLEYICQWTLKQTNQPETMIREVLECAGKWLDDMCATIQANVNEDVEQV